MGVKISELTAAANTTDTMQFEVNDGGTSKRVSLNQIKEHVGFGAQHIVAAALPSTPPSVTSSTDGIAIASGAVVSTGARAIAMGLARATGQSAFAVQAEDNSTTYGASGTNSIVGGYRNKASALYSSSWGGRSNTASGQYSGCFGGQGNQAIGEGAACLGGRTNRAAQDGQVSIGRDGPYYGYPDSLKIGAAGNGGGSTGTHVIALPKVTTTNATATPVIDLVSGSNALGGAFHALIVGYDLATDNMAAYEVKGAFKYRGVSSLVGTPVVTILGENVAAWNCTVTLSSPSVYINVVGAASTSIEWTGTVVLTTY